MRDEEWEPSSCPIVVFSCPVASPTKALPALSRCCLISFASDGHRTTALTHTFSHSSDPFQVCTLPALPVHDDGPIPPSSSHKDSNTLCPSALPGPPPPTRRTKRDSVARPESDVLARERGFRETRAVAESVASRTSGGKAFAFVAKEHLSGQAVTACTEMTRRGCSGLAGGWTFPNRGEGGFAGMEQAQLSKFSREQRRGPLLVSHLVLSR